MTRLFGVSLVTFEIMDGGFHAVAGFLFRANRVYFIAQHGQCLERHHGLVVFGEIAGQQQQFFIRHVHSSLFDQQCISIMRHFQQG